MGYQHNLMAHGAAKVLLAQLQTGTAKKWAHNRLTTRSTYWHGLSDWPRPDHAFEDSTTGSSLAIEFKPPSQPKREYVTGLGQCITYLKDFEFALMILPFESLDGFHIAEYLQNVLVDPTADSLPVGIIAYRRDPADQHDLKALLPLRTRKTSIPPIPRGIGRKVFWAYWRDLSQFEVLDILTSMVGQKRVSFENAFRRFWAMKCVKGKALNWEGERRKRKHRFSPSFNGERLNAMLSLKHIGAIDTDSKLTEAGYALLHTGRIYGANSVAFMKILGQAILQEGRHLDLILWVDEQQRNIPRRKKQHALEFYHELDKLLEVAGVIPAAPHGLPKATFLRDEQKLWNKLGLLIQRDRHSYFHSGEGLAFNWKAIISMLS